MHRLLVVDDEPQLLFSLREYLTRVGYEVRSADCGARALELLMESPPDLIVADILMDAMDGFEFQHRVNGLTGGCIPFIFLTAKGDLQDRLAGLRGGADDYVVKPFEPAELEARIASLLARVERTRMVAREEVMGDQGERLAQVCERLENPVADVACELDGLRTAGSHDTLTDRRLKRALARVNELGEMIADLPWATEGASPERFLKKEPQRIAPIVRSSAASAARLAAQRSVSLRITCGGLLTGIVDGQMLGRALSGLLEGVVAVSPKGSEVRLRARRAKESGIEITITDGGVCPGQSGDLTKAGSSQALDVARRVVSAHGGRFEIGVDDDRRSSLVIWLPGRVAKHVGKRV